mmetsp:Transcript_58788/g.156434  ORF Transcript_58788/g.156434 Transcript_58788/m.156434 type:complete len:219 (+) Transcript_58788:390-1046(+)
MCGKNWNWSNMKMNWLILMRRTPHLWKRLFVDGTPPSEFRLREISCSPGWFSSMRPGDDLLLESVPRSCFSAVCGCALSPTASSSSSSKTNHSSLSTLGTVQSNWPKLRRRPKAGEVTGSSLFAKCTNKHLRESSYSCSNCNTSGSHICSSAKAHCQPKGPQSACRSESFPLAWLSLLVLLSRRGVVLVSFRRPSQRLRRIPKRLALTAPISFRVCCM